MSLPNLKFLGPDGPKEFVPSTPFEEPDEDTIHLDNDNVEFKPITRVNTTAAIDSGITLEMMKKNIKRNLPRLHQLPEFKKIKREPIALVGGGPSLKDTKEELREFKNIIACGSAHDYVIEQGIVPTYATVCDPDAISANYLKYPHKDVNYLVSSGCDTAVYKALDGFKLTQWHCYSDEYLKHQAELEEDFQAVGGGCTVGLRSLSIALMFGYSDIHFFGFDSCLGVNKEHHAYGFTDEAKEQLGHIYQVRLGMNKQMNTEKIFYCAGYQLAQCSHFKEFYQQYHKFFTPTFHGEGLMTEVIRAITEERDKLAKKQGIELPKKVTSEPLKGLLTQQMEAVQ